MIYADYNGSAPLCQDVREYLIERIQNGPYANPNSIHAMGTKTLMGMENARAVCAKVLGADYNQVVFNSGATEGITTVFHSLLDGAQENGKNVFITGAIEHSAIINLGQKYERLGFKWLVLPVGKDGIFKMDVLKELLEENKGKVAMVTAMAANNETGIIQPFEEMAKICQSFDAKYFCDTTQYIGKTLYNFKESGADYAVTSGHKFGALTGCGLLLAKDTTTIKPIIIGGGQEKGLRGGTQNYIANETMAVALKYFESNLDKLENLNNKRLEFEKRIKTNFPKVVIIGENSPRLASTTYISYPGIHGQAVQIELESQDIYVTTSSACSDNEPVTSKVLKAMGVQDDVGRGVVRISIGLCSPLEYYDEIFDALSKAYEKLIKIKSY